MFLVHKMILIHEKDKSFNISWVKSETDWLKKLIYTGLIICSCWFAALLIVIIYNLNKSFIFYPLWIGISALVYWIGYVGISKSQQLKKRIELRKKRIINFKKNLLVEQKKTKGFSKVENHVKVNKSYLNSNLSLETLANDLNLSEGYISQIINKNSNFNFNDYINSLRINDAKAMLTNIEYDNYTIIAIGLEAGFNSKSSFYTAFKKLTGKTPIEYKKSVRDI
ncbi:AraC family transcriptional regulator [Flavivirga amylovorans]|uniref:AraC family transcriptional regulator n=1 Tax=Flavivirga amylovorans TaxID=870486 RepID=A0ABT8WXV3_9FLAO|nr:AraC family transcriptional regulator [Flavivirga amylovorans]MDO5986520.1 AraC family transcriptional regulator [Flavivirga amylovorans]